MRKNRVLNICRDDYMRDDLGEILGLEDAYHVLSDSTLDSIDMLFAMYVPDLIILCGFYYAVETIIYQFIGTIPLLILSSYPKNQDYYSQFKQMPEVVILARPFMIDDFLFCVQQLSEPLRRDLRWLEKDVVR